MRAHHADPKRARKNFRIPALKELLWYNIFMWKLRIFV